MIIPQASVDLSQIEEKIYQVVCELGRQMFREVLEQCDNELMLTRDHEKYRHKGKKQTTLKTVMGEVVYERALYRYTDEDGKKARVYLLDELIGEPVSGQISPLLAEKIAETSCEMSYREAAKAVSAMTGQTISHGGAWNVVQALGEQADKQEKEDVRLKATGRLSRALSSFAPMCLPEQYSQPVETILSAAKSPQRVGKGNNGFRHAFISANLPFMKDIFSVKPLI